MPIHCHLEKLVKKRGITYQILAGKVGLSYVGIWKIAHSKTNPSLKVIEKICRILRCEIGDLFSLKK